MHEKCRAALLKACRIFGGQKQLANKINVHPSRLNKWINRNKKLIPYACALEIEQVTQGEITCQDLLSGWEKMAESEPENEISVSEQVGQISRFVDDKKDK